MFKGVIVKNEKVKALLAESSNGIITTKQVTDAGLHRGILQKMVKEGELYCYGRGIYIQKSAWEDDFYLLQCKYARGIYSHDTALYLLGYSDRTPAQYMMTFPKGYNAPSLKQKNFDYAKDISFDDACNTIQRILDDMMKWAKCG